MKQPERRFHSAGFAFSAQAGEEAALLRTVQKHARLALKEIRGQALTYQLTAAFSRESYRKHIDLALAEFDPDLDLTSYAADQLRKGLQADAFGDEAYSAVQMVMGLRSGGPGKLDQHDFEEALNEALGLSTPSLVAAGGRHKAPRTPWLSKLLARAGSLGIKWSDRVSCDVRTAYTGYNGRKAMDYFNKNQIPMKQWVTRHDAKVRDTHAAADGQIVPVGVPFVVGSSLEMYPGDPSGQVGEWINCRCVVIAAGLDN